MAIRYEDQSPFPDRSPLGDDSHVRPLAEHTAEVRAGFQRLDAAPGHRRTVLALIAAVLAAGALVTLLMRRSPAPDTAAAMPAPPAAAAETTPVMGPSPTAPPDPAATGLPDRVQRLILGIQPPVNLRRAAAALRPGPRTSPDRTRQDPGAAGHRATPSAPPPATSTQASPRPAAGSQGTGGAHSSASGTGGAPARRPSRPARPVLPGPDRPFDPTNPNHGAH